MIINWDELTVEQALELTKAAEDTCGFEITAQSGRFIKLEEIQHG